jgi:hypothetical protein
MSLTKCPLTANGSDDHEAVTGLAPSGTATAAATTAATAREVSRRICAPR